MAAWSRCTTSSQAKVSAVQNINTTAPNNSTTDNSLEFGFNARVSRASFFGGYAAQRTVTNTCDSTNDPNTQVYCDQSQNGIPWLGTLKMAGSVTVAWGIQLGASFQSYRYMYAAGSLYTSAAGNGVGPGTSNARHRLEHHPHHAVCRRLQGPVHARCAGQPRHDGGDDERAARSRRIRK